MYLSARFRFASLIAPSVVCLLLNLVPPASAQIRESSDNIADIVTERTLEKLPGMLPAFPSSLASDRDVYLLIRGGAAVYDVRLLARPSVDPRLLAQALAEAVYDLYPRPQLVEWSKEDDYSAATFAYSRARFCKRSSDLSVPIGKLVGIVRAHGYIPHAVVRIPTYAGTTDLVLPYHQTEGARFYLADGAPVSTVATLKAELSTVDMFLAWFLMLGVVIGGLLGLAAAVLLACRGGADRETRGPLFTKLAMWPLGVSVAISTSVGFFYMSSLSAAKTSDLWLGSTMRANTIVFVMPNVAVFSILALAGLLIRIVLFPPRPPAVTADQAVLDTNARAIKRRTILIALIPFGIGIAAYLAIPHFVSHKSSLRFAYEIGALGLMHLGPLTVFWLNRAKVKAAEGDASDAELTRVAERIAQELNVRVNNVSVGRGEAARRYASVEYDFGGAVAVSHKAVEILSPSELEYAIAYTIALVARIRTMFLASFALVLPGPILLMAMLTGKLPLNSHWKLPVIFATMVGMFGYAAAGAIWSFRRARVSAMKRAIDVTSDPIVARSVHDKLIEFGAIAEGDSSKISRLKRQDQALLGRAGLERGSI